MGIRVATLRSNVTIDSMEGESSLIFYHAWLANLPINRIADFMSTAALDPNKPFDESWRCFIAGDNKL
jgi:hypothetical protein